MSTELNFEIKMTCEKCGASLNDGTYHYVQRERETVLEVPPCETCLEAVKEEGDTEGYKRAQEEITEAEKEDKNGIV